MEYTKLVDGIETQMLRESLLAYVNRKSGRGNNLPIVTVAQHAAYVQGVGTNMRLPTGVPLLMPSEDVGFLQFPFLPGYDGPLTEE